MYKTIPALIPAMLAASIGSASAQSPSAQGWISDGPRFSPYFSPNGVFLGGSGYGYGYGYGYAYPYGGVYGYAYPSGGLYNYAYPGRHIYVYTPPY
jgi:hypothetical protein